jgi:EAL domain-containing protein (putative c-di-GMP-specific phosphodiesterase class I)
LGNHPKIGRFPDANDLDQALRADELHTEYQPKTDLLTGEFVGVEALARWQSPLFGAVPPGQFVPVAEQSELIAKLTFRVLEDAIAACRRWREVRPDCSVAVNISPHMLAWPRFPGMVTSILERNGLPAGALIAEVSESSILSGLPMAADALIGLNVAGVRVSMDGFGTGYSSVLSLLRMPYTEIKIDRSFVAACATDPEAWKLVRATVSMARELGIRVVAEGIETEAVSARLRGAGCDIGQGWLFGRPMQEDAMLRWLQSPSSDPVRLVPVADSDTHSHSSAGQDVPIPS